MKINRGGKSGKKVYFFAVREIKSKNLIYLKGFLFLIIGFLSSFYLLAGNFSSIRLLFLILAIWGFCRFYYFMFYVVEKYVDGKYKFSGIGSFLIYLFNRK